MRKLLQKKMKSGKRHPSLTAKQIYQPSWLLLLTALAILTGTFGVYRAAAGSGDSRRPSSHAAIRIAANEPAIATDDELLEQYIRKYGADKAVSHLKTLPVDCHKRSHEVGRLSFKIEGTEAFGTMNSECMSGYTHGVTEAFFRKHGTDSLNKNLELICQGQQTGFYAHQCFHGVGHGLIAYNDYDLPASLKQCDGLPVSSGIASCYSGVFMENVVGAIAVDEAKARQDASSYHSSEWLSSDPLYPCNAIDKKYKNDCYYYQSSRMVQVLGANFQKIAAACASIETAYQPNCFSSMGRDVSNSLGTDYISIESSCNYAPTASLQSNCLHGASQDKFWHESEQDDALAMCRAMRLEQNKQDCYRTLTGRAREIIADGDGKKAFCNKFEAEYQDLCRI